MFDYMVRILDNNRILIRDTSTGEVEVILPKDVGAYFNKVLEEQIEKQDEVEKKAAKIKESVE